MPIRLWIIDDDLMSREVLTLLAAEAGLDAVSFDSGEAALEALASPPAPDAILADLQMPGLCGVPLAERLRAACPPATALLAMSGSPAPNSLTSAYDAFLLKPFTMEELIAVLEHRPAPSLLATPTDDILNPAIYEAFAKSMPPAQLSALYAMSLDDADRRIGLMRVAREAEDQGAYRAAAHSIKGGCGMVGATQLAALASRMETGGPEAIDNIDPLQQFLDASAHLRRILDALKPG